MLYEDRAYEDQDFFVRTRFLAEGGYPIITTCFGYETQTHGASMPITMQAST